jgi:hypothetical protein
MLVSGRQAVRLLLARGATSGEAQARSLLRAGAAGRGVVTGAGVLFDGDAVRALADRPWLDEAAQREACPHGAYIARLSRSSSVDLTRPWAAVVGSVDGAPRMPTMTAALLGVLVTAAGCLPWIATLHGYVVLGADLHGFESDQARLTRFRLAPPGDWFRAWSGYRVAGPRGGRPWVILGPRGS